MSRRDGMVRTRDGDLVEAPKPTATDQPVRPHDCDRGWVTMTDGVAPCATCRPEAVKRLRERLARDAARRRGVMVR